jgi:hypothetical protein
MFAGDLFHPNAAGHALWAELFEPWIHRALPLLAPRCMPEQGRPDPPSL